MRGWLEREALIFKARQNGLSDDPWVIARMEDINNQLLLARLWEIELSNLPTPTIDQIRKYYNEHIDDFKWKNSRLVVDFWKSEKPSTLERKAQELNRKRPLIPQPGALEPLETGRMELTEDSSVTPEIWSNLKYLKEGQVSKVFKVGEKFYLFQIVKKNEAGTPQSLEDAQETIINILKEEARAKKISEYPKQVINELQNKGQIDINISLDIKE